MMPPFVAFSITPAGTGLSAVIVIIDPAPSAATVNVWFAARVTLLKLEALICPAEVALIVALCAPPAPVL